MTGRHIVIAGQGRAGSTLLYNMLRHALTGFEMPPAEQPALGWVGRPGNYCTKRPFDIFDMPRIIGAAAGRKRVDLIVTLRDPRDIITSHHASVPGDYFYAADRCYFVPPDGSAPRFANPGVLPVQHAIVKVLNAGLFPQGVFLLKYEDLVRDPDLIQRKLALGFDLDFHARMADFHQVEIPSDLQGPLNGVRAAKADRTARWRAPEHAARIRDQFTRFPELHDVVVGLGYEPDRSWFDDIAAAA